MARKRSSVSNQTNAVTIDVDRQKYGRWAAILLFGLIAGIFFCLICGWISGDTSYNEISDNIVTALLQNYNYILASLVLIPVIAYIYSKIKAELNIKSTETSLKVDKTNGGVYLEKATTVNDSTPSTDKLITEAVLVDYVQNAVLPAVTEAINEALADVVTYTVDDGTTTS